MKITNVECHYLRLPQVEAIASGVQDALIVVVHTDDGITGIGEVDSSPAVGKAIVEAPMSHSLATGFRHLLIGEDPLERERLWRKLYDGTYYFGRRGAVIHALSGIDMALWDIAGKVAGQPIHRLLGASYRDRVVAYGSVLFPDAPEEAYEKACRLFEEGFTAVKFGWGGFGKDWKRDLAFVRALRDAAGEEREIFIDAGMCWDAPTAIRMAEEMASYRPYWLEEPLNADDWEGYRLLTSRSPIPIAAGEEETTRYGFRDLMERGGVSIIQPDLSRCGGITEGWKLAFLAELYGRRIVPHAFSTGVLLATSLQFLAALPESRAPFLEFPQEPSPLFSELTDPAPSLQSDGTVLVPNGPGLGVELREDVLRRYQVS